MRLLQDRIRIPLDRPGRGPRPRKRRGAAAVELAVLAPLIGLILLGMLEMGRAMMARSLLTDASRKACRTAILPRNANSAITADVANILSDNGLDISKATVTIQVNGKTVDASTAKQNDAISVKVAMPYSQFAWTTPFFLTNTSIESEVVVMMRQG
jgi:Flp pilus assembly protein TadG